MAKKDGNAARARAPEARPRGTSAKPSPSKGGHLTPIDGNAAIPLELDRVIHERLRLVMVSALAVNDSLSFNELKALLDASDGNVSVHARKLEDAGYLSCTKGFDGRIPRTEYRLTAQGRRALERYLAHMEALIKQVGRP